MPLFQINNMAHERHDSHPHRSMEADQSGAHEGAIAAKVHLDRSHGTRPTSVSRSHGEEDAVEPRMTRTEERRAKERSREHDSGAEAGYGVRPEGEHGGARRGRSRWGAGRSGCAAAAGDSAVRALE